MALNKVSDKIKGFSDWHGTSLADFDEWLSIVSNQTYAIYRGQRKYWPLLPSISRGNNSLCKLLSVEEQLFNNLKVEARKCFHLIPSSDWDWLVVGLIESLQTSRPFSGNRTKISDTEFKIPRIREQEGCFTLFKYIENSAKGFVPLERNVFLRKRIGRIRIANYSASEILIQIEKKGIAESIMFPDIDQVIKLIKEQTCNRRA